jgi:hypothetical protein
MDEKHNPLMQPSESDVRRDPRPSDIDIFYELLPGVLGALAGKSSDANSATSMALMMVRQMLGQCAMMGILRTETRLMDGSPLAAVTPNMGQGNVGVAPPVSMYPNQPGMGQPAQGAVQYPNYGGGQQGGNGRGPMPGQTSNIQPVAMFPNNSQAPQL